MCGIRLERSHAEGNASLISQRSRKFLVLHDDLFGGKCIYIYINIILINSIAPNWFGLAAMFATAIAHAKLFLFSTHTDLSACTNDMARISVAEELLSISADHDRVVHVDDTDFRLQASLVGCVSWSGTGDDRGVGCGKFY